MPLFKYIISDKDGKKLEGLMEAKDKFDLYHNIKKPGINIISTEELKGGSRFSWRKIIDSLDGVKAHDRIIFAKNLAKMMQAGLSITKGLSIMESESSGYLKRVITKVIDSISKGNTLSESIKNYPKVFSDLFVAMVKAGEESGNLPLALENIGMQLEKSYLLNKKIRGALIYPGVIISLMIGIGVLMMIYVVPTLTSTFKSLGVALPFATRAIIATSSFLIEDFVYVLLGIFITVFVVVYTFRTKKGKRFADFALIHLPVVGSMVKQVNSARTARTLSSLITSGVDIVVAIGVTKDVIQNSYYKDVLQTAQDTIQKGETISKVFGDNKKLYPTFVSEMVSVGEETGKIGEMLLNVAAFYEDEIDQKTKDMSAIIEPALMIFIGVGVGLFAVSIISPIYSIGDSIK
ncbi:MAG: type II secretion system F family protein [Minisyncoccia bacterium]